MNVIQRPDQYSYASTMKDYLIDSDKTITFLVKYNGKVILEEDYSPDANYQIRIRDLGKLCRLALWGIWPAADQTPQGTVAGNFTFAIDGTDDMTGTVAFTRMLTKNNAMTGFTNGCFLSNVFKKITCQGVQEWITAVLPAGKIVEAAPILADGSKGNIKSLTTAVEALSIVAIDVSSGKIFPNQDIAGYSLYIGSSLFQYVIEKSPAMDLQIFRYKNLFDVPETIICRGGIEVKGANESTTGEVYEITRKLSVKNKNEYTAKSGAVYLQSDYKLWHDLMNAQEVEMLYDGDWYPIIIDKHEYSRNSRGKLETLSFTFNLANAEAANIVLL